MSTFRSNKLSKVPISKRITQTYNTMELVYA